MIIGAQLYTVREFTKNLNDFSETLKKIADIGYKSVQVSGTCDFSPEWLEEKLKKNGLTCDVTHTNPERLLENTQDVILDHSVYNCNYIGIGTIPNGIENYSDFVANYKPVGKKICENNKTFCYHNHDIEFIKSDNKKLYIERMAEDFFPTELNFIVDTFWVQAAGGDPIWWIKNLKDRVPCVHLKDMIYDGQRKFAPIFEGNMNFDGILNACEDANTEFIIVEQDDCYGEDPFKCLKTSFQNLKTRGLS